MLLSAGIVALTYVIPLAAMAWARVPVEQFSTGSWAAVARSMAGAWLGAAIVIGGAITSLGMFNALTMSYARLPMAVAGDGLLLPLLGRTNRRGVPWVAVLACAAAWALALPLSFERLISLDLILYGSSLILEFVALVVLRVREPQLERPFRAGSLAATCAIAAVPSALIVYAMYVSRHERMGHMPALALGALIAALGPVCYLASRMVWLRPADAVAAGD
jgi:amino acid transporter